MALTERVNLTIKTCLLEGCSKITVEDITGTYNATTNPLGYGLPGGIAYNDITQIIISVYYPNITTPIIYTFTYATGTVTALTDEFELFKGGNIFMAKEGNEYLGYLKQSSDCSRKKIEVFWNKNGLFKWKFLTLIKHFTYDLKRDGRSFCKGIVFSLDDI